MKKVYSRCFISVFLILCISATARSQNYFKKAGKAFNKGDFKSAMELYQKAADAEPEAAGIVYNVGYCQYELKDYNGCMATINRAISMDSTDVTFYFLRAKSQSALEEYNRAIEDYTRCIRMDPRYFSYFNRAIAKHYLEDCAGAIDDYSIAIKMNPDDYDGYMQRAFCREELDDYIGALSDYDQAIALNPKDADLYSFRGTVKLSLDRFSEAEKDYKTSLSLNPKDVTTRLSLTEVYLITTRYDLAFQLATQARALATEQDDILISLFMTCAAGTMLDQDISEAYNILLKKTSTEEPYDAGWSFEDVSDFINQPTIPSQKREFINALITLFETIEEEEDF